MVRSVFHLTLRATEGFLRSLFHLLEWELPVPDYTTLCKRAKHLAVSLLRKAAGPLHLVLDSTGLKVFGEGEWKVRQHGYTKRRTWRKLHLSVDSETQEIQAVVLSEASLDDAGAVPDLLNQSTESVEQIGGDGAYDKRKVYEDCAARGIRRVAIPPRKNARIWQHCQGKVCPAPTGGLFRRPAGQDPAAEREGPTQQVTSRAVSDGKKGGTHGLVTTSRHRLDSLFPPD